MLYKRNNSVITLAVLLAVVGVSRPAKAFLLAQADEVKTTFTLPDELPKNATVQVAASNSFNSIDQGLKASFTDKYPNAKVNIKTQSSDEALNALAAGKTDIAAIGRSLTEAEKSKGLVAVPVSREKIALVVSKNNPYSGNLSFSQFAQIFKGEITDWSEVGGNPGEIKLVDLPDSNDTRRAFSNYSIFQDGELATGSNSVKVGQDNTEAMVSQLGDNGISYAVADDVINRDDVKVVSMHQTQPDDPRYPFSQPFNLVYQGTPSEATQAFLGFATTKEGQKTIASRVGSIPTTTAAATAIAPNLGNKTPEVTLATVDSSANANADANNKVAQADGNTPTLTQTNADLEGSGTANPDLEGSGKVNPELESSGTPNFGVDGSGKVNPEFQDSGVVNPDLEGSGEVNPDVEGSGTANIDAIAQTDANPNAADTENTQGDAIATKKGNWWWWIPLIIGLPLLGLLGMSSLKRGNRSDREPAIANTPSPNDPQGGTGVAFDPDIDGISPRRTTATDDLGTTSSLGGAAIAGGAAATNRTGDRNNKDIEEVDTDRVELENVVAQPETDIDNLIVEIPSDPVNEFTTDQETKLQTTEQSTRLQVDDLNDSSGLLDNISASGAALGGSAAAASGFFSDREDSVEETTESVTEDNDTIYAQSSYVDEPDYPEATANFDRATEEDTAFETENAREFRGDYVLREEIPTEEINSEIEDEDTTAIRDANWTDSSTSEWNTPDNIVSDSVDNTPTTEADLEIEDSDFILDTRIDNDFETNIIADAEVTSDETDYSLDDFANSRDISLDEITFDDADSSVNASLDEFTFDNTADSRDISVEEITFDDTDSFVSAISDELTLDDTTDSTEISLDEITFDDADSLVNTSSDEIVLDETTDSTEINLNEITFEDADSSIDDLINSIGTDTLNQRVDLDELGFDESLERKDNASSDLLSGKTAEITDLADDKSDDMDNISTWLDELETPDQNTENISEWLENLNADSANTDSEKSNSDQTSRLNEEDEDISFQFLEDLLDRDPNANQDDK